MKQEYPYTYEFLAVMIALVFVMQILLFAYIEMKLDKIPYLVADQFEDSTVHAENFTNFTAEEK